MAKEIAIMWKNCGQIMPFDLTNLWEKILEPDNKKLAELISSLPDETKKAALQAKTVKSFVTLKASKK